LPPAASPIRVAIVGGGCSGITTAFDLTRPELEGRYEVTVYQQGWRLGGKGASGRGPGDRIEEHGLHLWMGFYENAFRLLRECYVELDRDPATCRFAKWDDVFFADPLTGVKDDHADGTTSHWITHFPSGAGTPGDPDAPLRLFSAADYMTRAIALVEALLVSARREELLESAEEPATEPTAGLAPLMERVSRLIRYGQLASVTAVLEGTQLLRMALQGPNPLPSGPLLELVDLVGRFATEQLEALVGQDTELRRIYEIVDLTLTCVRGSIRHGLVSHPDGFDAINDYDWREWLRMNGASERAMNSSFLHSLYNIGFAFEDGDMERPAAAAGDALRCAVRAFLTYRGSFFWKMRTGMGDAIFAPFYEVLLRRGVRFEFFHRLENVCLSPPVDGERPHVAALEFDVQAEMKDGGPYRPLVDVDGVPCWPAGPDWDQLRDGERLRAEGVEFESWWDRHHVGQRTLEVERDFDLVVLGVGIGAIPYVAGELVERVPGWDLMVRKVKTTATQAFQLWLSEPVETLGWDDAPVNLTQVPGDFETWADMRQLIADERFVVEPKALGYFCSSLHTPPELPSRDEVTYPADQRKRVRDSAIHSLNHGVGAVWPGAVRDGRFRWELVVDPAGRTPEEIGDGDVARFETQFWTANVNPSDRYVLFVPGSSRYRISPLDDSVDNLTISGDWTACGLNVGCVEAAVMSGRLAAHALSGFPKLEDITGYDHP
jgi:uncharacterized protein with NAD-binding domain and iron-sulfur cluster